MEPAELARIVATAVTTALQSRADVSVLSSPKEPFAALAREWLAETRHRPSWRREVVRLLAGPLAALPDHPTRDDVGRVLRSLRAPATHNHALAVVGAVYRWGLATGRVSSNPAHGFKRRHIAARSRVLTMDELRQVYSAGCPITKLLILTGARASEIGGLAWTEVQGDRLALPPERVKNGRAHMVPMTAQALALLPGRRPGYPHVFGRRRRAGFSGWAKLKRGLPVLGSPWVLHDIRRSAATHWAEQRLADADLIELMLGHVRPGLRAVYNRAPRWEERTELAWRWADLVASL